jgi:hypothetical protein
VINVVQNMSPTIVGVIQAIATVLAALIVGVAGVLISRKFTRLRDEQDRESQWRQHAIDLTKLDQERMIKMAPPNSIPVLRPAILDFLANYRDLQELGDRSPKDLYQVIIERRISQKKSPDTSKTGEQA